MLKATGRMNKDAAPDFSLENGFSGPVCGLDEAGRGPLAGPVVAACVYIPEEKRKLAFVTEINDSKKLSESKRNSLFPQIQDHCLWGIAECSPREIDEFNILQASLKAMERAFSLLSIEMSHALIDGNHSPKALPCPCTPVIKGDRLSVSIAAASILAKVTRDRMMRNLAQKYPHYGWERNAGYPTAQHREALALHGPTPHHRRSFGPVRICIEK